jgi:hypothetical protein
MSFRVYNTESKEMISKTYLKQRLHSLIFCKEGIIEEPSEEENKEHQENKDEDDFIPPLIDDEDEELLENEEGH